MSSDVLPIIINSNFVKYLIFNDILGNIIYLVLHLLHLVFIDFVVTANL